MERQPNYRLATKKPDHIMVSISGDAKTSMTITWRASAEVTEGYVEFSEKGGEKKRVQAITNEFKSDVSVSRLFWAKLEGLKPGTRYYYTCGSAEERSEEYYFDTEEENLTKFKFIAISDHQKDNDHYNPDYSAFNKFLKNVLKKHPDVKFILTAGDNTNCGQHEIQWNAMYEGMEGVMEHLPYMMCCGNHDNRGFKQYFPTEQGRYYAEPAEFFNAELAYSYPLNGPEGWRPENYSFDYGNVHFAVLNTNDLLSVSIAQLKWLENDMNSTDKDWKIVFMHKSPYTLGKDGKWPDALYLQKSLTKVLDRCGVDLVMSGHDHQYLRTKPLKHNKINEDGTVYILSGTAGTKRYEVRPFLANHFLDTDFIAALTVQKRGWGNYWNGSDWEQTRQSNIGGCFNCISVDGGTLTLKSYILADKEAETDPEIITQHDELVLTKQTGQNKITFTGDNTTSKFEYYIGVVPSFLMLAGYAFGEWLPKFFIMLPALLDSVINKDIF